ncbi:glycosyltransferase involved in cell wall biosynthesis [Spinactinospora alkalitolerans]|uniref:Glycosyltransferase involved in cell wall biosynthesis n=1 Tax=Spinactinospora alkalitolerans TaxID=687207 RepID=A0A852TTM9_9ACTN|nr:glycosyltransferase [Spinactinospora alkalitolerans]NYE47278.1 glycosyltransferase involved in cell wall biosynthesis [Spinactinospora alkalitolerans]
MRDLTVLVNAGPWLPVPPDGYGGIENVVAALVPELRARGVRVVLATTGSSTLPADEYLSVFPDGQYAHIQSPYNQVMGIAHAHVRAVLERLRRRGDVHLVHDHMEVVGPAVLTAAGSDIPPVLHTLHWDLGKHPDFYAGFAGNGRVFVNGVSASQLERAPAALRAHSAGHAHLATPLAVDADRRGGPAKRPHFAAVGRITALKGTHIAARTCRRLGLPLVLAGPVNGIDSAEELERVLADRGDPRHGAPDVRYYAEQVRPHVDGDLVRWVGTVAGAELEELLATARAALFPVQWAEPGGTAVVEALACGAPAVGFARGCLPELVRHGRTGLLARTEEEFEAALHRTAEIDPADCRKEAAARFTPAVMAERYLELYERVLSGAGGAAVPAPRVAGQSGRRSSRATG